ncbi:hypothetical protein AOLI_G00215920 [Acnodon oligacanthus]
MKPSKRREADKREEAAGVVAGIDPPGVYEHTPSCLLVTAHHVYMSSHSSPTPPPPHSRCTPPHPNH